MAQKRQFLAEDLGRILIQVRALRAKYTKDQVPYEEVNVKRGLVTQVECSDLYNIEEAIVEQMRTLTQGY